MSKFWLVMFICCWAFKTQCAEQKAEAPSIRAPSFAAVDELIQRRKFAEALEILKLLDRHDDSMISYDIGVCEYELHQYENAKKSFLEAQLLYQQNKTPSQSILFKLARLWRQSSLSYSISYNLGNTEFQLSRYQDAIAFYERALTMQPNSIDARHNLQLAQRASHKKGADDFARILKAGASKEGLQPLMKFELPDELSAPLGDEDESLLQVSINEPEEFGGQPPALSKQAEFKSRQQQAIEELKQQLKTDLAFKEAELEIENWTSSLDKVNSETSVESNDAEVHDMLPIPGLDKTLFKVFPKDPALYSSKIFDVFNPLNATWSSKLHNYTVVPFDRDFDHSSEAVPFTVVGNIFSEDLRNKKVSLATREGYGVDPLSVRFQDSSIRKHFVVQNSLGSYLLKFDGGSPGSRFSYQLKKLAHPEEDAVRPTERDTESWITNVPPKIKAELEPLLSKQQSYDDRADTIEAFILRQPALYTHNNDLKAQAVRDFIHKGVGGQGRFDQMARILFQKADTNFPLAVAGLNCELWAEFYLALLRYYGIPARFVFGFSNRFPMDNLLTSQEGHAWITFWSNTKQLWVWRNPTPRGGLTDEQQTILNQDAQMRGAGEGVTSSADDSKVLEGQGSSQQSPDLPSDQAKQTQKESTKKGKENWLGDDVFVSRQFTAAEQKRLKSYIQFLTQKANELREQQSMKSQTPMEKMFAANLYRRNQLLTETKLTSDMLTLGHQMSILSTKKKLNGNELVIVKNYQQSLHILTQLALQTLIKSPFDPRNDPYLATADLHHALALLEAVTQFEPQNQKQQYAQIMALAQQKLTNLSENESIYETVAQSANVQLVIGNKKLYQRENGSFIFKEINFDVSKYREFVLGTISRNKQHYAFVAKFEDKLHLIRDGKVSELLLSPFDMNFFDADGQVLEVSGLKSDEQLQPRPHVTLINESVLPDFSFIGVKDRGTISRPDLGVACKEVLVQNVYICGPEEVWQNGQPLIDPHSGKPVIITDDYLSNRSIVLLDQTNFVVVRRNSDGTNQLMLNGVQKIGPSFLHVTIQAGLIESDRVMVTSQLTPDQKISDRWMLNDQHELIRQPAVTPNGSDEAEIQVTIVANRLHFKYQNKPLRFWTGTPVTTATQAADVDLSGSLLNFSFYAVGPFDLSAKYMVSHIFKFDFEQAKITPLKLQDANGQEVQFDMIRKLVTSPDHQHFAAVGRRGKSIYLIKDGRIVSDLPPLRANPVSDSGPSILSILASVKLSPDSRHTLFVNGGWNFPKTYYLDNVPILTLEKQDSVFYERSKNIDVACIDRTKTFLFYGHRDFAERLKHLTWQIIDPDKTIWEKTATLLLDQPQLSYDELLYLVQNVNDQSQSDFNLQAEVTRRAKRKIIENIVRLPSLPMTRISRVQAVMRAIDWWRDEMDQSGPLDQDGQKTKIQNLAKQLHLRHLAEIMLETLEDALKFSGLDVSLDLSTSQVFEAPENSKLSIRAPLRDFKVLLRDELFEVLERPNPHADY